MSSLTRTSRLASTMIVFSSLMILPARPDAQKGNRECVAWGTEELAGCLFDAHVVDAPFTADAVTTWTPPASRGIGVERATARYFRDRAGRMRIEQMFVGQELNPQRIIVTPDADSRVAYMLDPVARTAVKTVRGAGESWAAGGGFNRFLLPLSAGQFVAFSRLPLISKHFGSELDEEPLGERSTDGVRTKGVRFTSTIYAGAFGLGHPLHMTDERWVSPDLKLVVYNRGEDAEIGVIEYKVSNIRRTDVSADLFVIPEDHSLIPQPPMTYENPYVQWPGYSERLKPPTRR